MGSWAAADEPRAPRRKNKVIEYTKLRRATRRNDHEWPDPDEYASDRRRKTDDDNECEGRCSERPLCQDVEGDAAHEGPHQAAFETDRDRPDDREHEDKMRLGIAHPNVRTDREFDDRCHRRSDRGDEQGHG